MTALAVVLYALVTWTPLLVASSVIGASLMLLAYTVIRRLPLWQESSQ